MPGAKILEQAGGAALMLLFLADVFLTVLYARAGTGLLAPSWNRAIWSFASAVARLAGRRRGTVLSFAGPLIVVSLIAFWALGLALGSALIIHPELGGAIRPSSGGPSTDFVTALLVAGNSLSIVGSGDYAPHTAATRLLFLANSLIGASVLSLVLSYLVQVYSALRERNALALTVDLMTGGTGDAAELLVRLIPGGDASDAVSELGSLARSLAAVKEAHHFYPLLFYFRFENPLYSVSRFTFVLLDLATLIATALDQRRYAGLTRSAPVGSLEQGSLMLLETLGRAFPSADDQPYEDADMWQMRQGYVAASAKLDRDGIPVQADGVAYYIAARARWEPLIRRMAPALGHRIEELDRRGSQNSDARSRE
jgi:hypothetical protein